MTPRPALTAAAPAAVAVALASALALGGCGTTWHNAPGVTQLEAPPRIERGDPAAFEPAADPGRRTLVAIVAPGFAICVGCKTDGAPASEQAGEFGGEVILEYSGRARERGGLGGLGRGAWGLGLGFQAGFNHHDRAGTFHASLNRRFFIGGILPGAVNAGVALATDGMPGLQVSAHYVMLMTRLRAVAGHGIEFIAGAEWPIPLLFRWSR